MSRNHNCPVVPINQAPPADTSAYRRVVLIVDDEVTIADTLTKILSSSGYAAIAAYDAEEALEIALLTPPEMIITDVFLPGMSGIEFAVSIKRIFPDCKILLFSGHAATSDLMTDAKTAGHHFNLLSKPVHPKDLLAHVALSLNSKADSPALSIAS